MGEFMNPANMASGENDLPVFFWRESDNETGWLSQWYYCPFKDQDNSKVIYATAEQFVLTHDHSKPALLTCKAT